MKTSCRPKTDISKPGYRPCQAVPLRKLHCFKFPLIGTGSATSNDMKLVHQPLMGGLLHLAARPGASSLYQMQQPTHQRLVYTVYGTKHRVAVQTIVVLCSAVLMCPVKELSRGNVLQLKSHSDFSIILRVRTLEVPLHTCIATHELASLVTTVTTQLKRSPTGMRLRSAGSENRLGIRTAAFTR